MQCRHMTDSSRTQKELFIYKVTHLAASLKSMTGKLRKQQKEEKEMEEEFISQS